MTWTNKDNDKFIYMLDLDVLGEDSLLLIKYQAMDSGLKKTNKAITVSVDTMESMSIATITTNTPQGIIYLPNINVQYTNEITKQFAFITKSTIHKNKKALIANDKQLMMKIIKKIIKKKIILLEYLRTGYTYPTFYDNVIAELYQRYKTLNNKIKFS